MNQAEALEKQTRQGSRMDIKPVSQTSITQQLQTPNKPSIRASAWALGRRVQRNMPGKFLPLGHNYTRSRLLNYLIRPFAALFRTIGIYRPELIRNPKHARLMASLTNALGNIPTLLSPEHELQEPLKKLQLAFQDQPEHSEAYQQGSANFWGLTSELKPLAESINQATKRAADYILELEGSKNNKVAKNIQKRLSTELAGLIGNAKQFQNKLDQVNLELEKLNDLLPDHEKLADNWQNYSSGMTSGPITILENILQIIAPPQAQSVLSMSQTSIPISDTAVVSVETPPAAAPIAISYVLDTTPLTSANLEQSDESTPKAALSNRSTTDSVLHNQEELSVSIHYTSKAIREFSDNLYALAKTDSKKIDPQKRVEYEQQAHHFLQLADQLRDEVIDRKKTTNDLIQSYEDINPTDPVTHSNNQISLRNKVTDGIYHCKLVAATYLHHYAELHKTIDALTEELLDPTLNSLTEPFHGKQFEIADSGIKTLPTEDLLQLEPSQWPVLHKLQHNEASARKALEAVPPSNLNGGG